MQTIFDQYSKAVRDKNIDLLLSMYDSSVVVFDLWEAWSYEGAAPFRQMVTGWFDSLGKERVEAEFSETRVVKLGECSLATATVTYTAVSEDGKPLRSLQNRLTWVAKQTNGVWKIFHEHTSAPVDPQSGKARLKR